MFLESLKSKELSSCLHHFSGNFCCSWAEFSQAIFDEALKLEVIASKPNVVAITTEQFLILAKRSARSELNSKKMDLLSGLSIGLYAWYSILAYGYQNAID